MLFVFCLLLATLAYPQVIQTPFGPIVNPWHHLTGRVSVVYDERGLSGAAERLDDAMMEICKPDVYRCDEIFRNRNISFYHGNALPRTY